MVRFMSLSSGSCGNCYYLGTENGGIVIDAGVSLRRLKKVLLENDLDMDSFSAVLVTHDHLGNIFNVMCSIVRNNLDNRILKIFLLLVVLKLKRS